MNALSFAVWMLIIAVSTTTHVIVPNTLGIVPTFQSLSADQRLHLPDSTKVRVGNYVTTLGQLRLEHRSRMLHIQNAKLAGGTAALGLQNVKPIHFSPSAVNPVVLNPNMFKPGGQVIEPPSTYSQTALDMQNFCNAAQATVCLYYPASTTFCQCGGWASDIDPYITDASVCASQGGLLLQSGCQYNYNTWYKAQFNPGSGFTTQVNCDPNYWIVTTIDNHGAIQVNTTVPEGSSFATGGSPSTCIIRAYVSP